MTNDSIKIMDPNILLSIINMKLRDQYDSLDILCYDLQLTKEYILNRLKEIDYNYNEEKNQFN